MSTNENKNLDTIKVEGKTYVVGKRYFDGELEVMLSPVGTGDSASSFEKPENYGYTHGGSTYRAAVEKAWEIRDAIAASR